jgi:hypothetical protein
MDIKTLNMMYVLVVLIAILAVVASDPDAPTFLSQYSIKGDSNIAIDTNAGFPPHYTETMSNTYFDFEKQSVRYDISENSYGTKAPFTQIYKYGATYPVKCVLQEVQAPRGYLIKDNTCCYADLVDNCDSVEYVPTARTMFVPALPKTAKYAGEVNGMNLWEQNIYLKNPEPVETQDFYFDTDGTYRENYMHIVAGPQFINATTTYPDSSKWTAGPVDASIFSEFDDICANAKLCNGAQVTSFDRCAKRKFDQAIKK